MNQNQLNKSKVMLNKRSEKSLKILAIMCFNIKTAMVCLLLTVVLFSNCKTNKDNVDTEKPKSLIVPDEFGQRLIELQQKIETVEIKLQEAEGLARNMGIIDMRIANYFADYVEWELEHPEMMKEALSSNDYFKEQETLSPEQIDQRYEEHIHRELSDAMVLLS